MLEKPDFEQDFWSRTAIGTYKNGHHSIRIMKCICYYDGPYFGKI